MKIAILSRSKSIEVLSLKEEGEKEGHSVDIIDPKKLVFTIFKNTFEIYTDTGVNILSYDAYIPRYFGITTGKYRKNSKGLVVRYLTDHNKIVLDSIEGKRFSQEGKIFSFSKYLESGLSLIPTLYLYSQNLDKLDQLLKEHNISSPYILKDIKGVQGKNIYKVNSKDEITNIIKKNVNIHFMIQPFIGIEHDLRILVLGDKILGCMDKIHKNNDFKGNIAQGAIGVPFNITNDIIKISNIARFRNGADFCGVDIAITKDTTYLLEVNRSPQYKGFMNATGINVSKEIIKYLEYLYVL